MSGLLSGRLKSKKPVAPTRPAKAPEPNPSTGEVTAEKTKSIITDEVTLYTTKNKEPLTFTYEIASVATKNVKFTMNFNGSVNFSAVDGSGNNAPNMQLNAVVPPGGKLIVGTVSLVDKEKGARLEVEYDFQFEEPDSTKVAAAAAKNEKEIDAMLKPGANNKNLFIDPEFKPVKPSLYTVNTAAIATGEETGMCPPGEVVAWYRASEIFKDSKCDVFEGKIEPGDILQGALGDCWFLCAVACLAEFPSLVEDLFPADSKKYNPTGKYSIRFCEAGFWETFVVDDFIPCYPEGGPMYAKGHGNELWVMLLEKAYAKMCGSYSALKAGWAFEAMMDMTGAPYWTARFDEADMQKAIADGSLWQAMLTNDAANYIQSASTPGEDVLTVGGDRKAKDGETGLVAGHAYAVMTVKEVKSKGLKLVQLRNPWGEGGMEWNGDWSDNSFLWTPEIKSELGIDELNPDDGAFWMSFDDFTKNFFSVNASLVRHPDLGSSKWFESRKKMQFTMSASFDVKAPSYLMTLSEASDKVYFSVHQKDIRNIKAEPYIDFGVTVLQLNAATGKYSLMASSGNSADRQNQTKEMSLPAGQYLIIPTSTGCVLRTLADKKLNATVVVHSTRPHGLVEQAFNAEAYEEAIELPVIKDGTVRELEGGLIKLYTRKSGFSGASYVIQNNHTRDLKFTQDCSCGKNIISSNGVLKVTTTVPKGESKVTHHLAPATTVGAWQSGFTASYEWV